MPFPTESVKELVFGGAVGLCVGVVAKRVDFGLGVGVVGGMAATLFVFLRGAIFDGRIRASWSPLAIDDSSLPAQLKRKARKEAYGAGKRTDLFLRENLIVLSGFGCAYAAGATL